MHLAVNSTGGRGRKFSPIKWLAKWQKKLIYPYLDHPQSQTDPKPTHLKFNKESQKVLSNHAAHKQQTESPTNQGRIIMCWAKATRNRDKYETANDRQPLSWWNQDLRSMPEMRYEAVDSMLSWQTQPALHTNIHSVQVLTISYKLGLWRGHCGPQC